MALAGWLAWLGMHALGHGWLGLAGWLAGWLRGWPSAWPSAWHGWHGWLAWLAWLGMAWLGVAIGMGLSDIVKCIHEFIHILDGWGR